MSEPKHTPGPWHARDRGIGWEVHPGCKCGALFCEPINNQSKDTFKEADAKLIAASPDLLAAIKNLMEPDAVGPEEAMRLAHSAIAKAERR